MIAVVYEAVFDVVEDGAGGSSSENTCRILLIQRRRLLVISGHMLQLSASLLLVHLSYVVEDLFNGSHGNLSLRHIRSIQTVNAVRAEDTGLLLDHALATEAFFNKETESSLHVANLANQVVELVEVVAVRL